MPTARATAAPDLYTLHPKSYPRNLQGYKFAFNCGVRRRQKHPDHDRSLNRFSYPKTRVQTMDAQLIAPGAAKKEERCGGKKSPITR